MAFRDPRPSFISSGWSVERQCAVGQSRLLSRDGYTTGQGPPVYRAGRQEHGKGRQNNQEHGSNKLPKRRPNRKSPELGRKEKSGNRGSRKSRPQHPPKQPVRPAKIPPNPEGASPLKNLIVRAAGDPLSYS